MMKSQSEQDYLKQASEEVLAKASLGAQMPVDPDVAEYMGAFEEDALSNDEALMSLFDIDPETGCLFEEDVIDE